MTTNEKYMHRCFQLAKKGIGKTRTNPLVGAVIVYDGKIIGEGYHRQFGKEHAEVNAIKSVKNRELLSLSTMYVSLEPCSHYGKTPPCSKLIVDEGIKKVVVATVDPNPQVSGKGIAFLQSNGIDTTVGVLEDIAREQNRVFFVNQQYHRPYIILKWAKSRDGFIDYHRKNDKQLPVLLSNSITQCLTHKLRAENAGIMVGTNTVLKDNPKLTTRKWFGENPVRVIIDRENKIGDYFSVMNNQTKTIIFTQNKPSGQNKIADNIVFEQIDFSDNTNFQILKYLYSHDIQSVMIEGGAKLLNSFIEMSLWDEAFVEISQKKLVEGIKSPDIQGEIVSVKKFSYSTQIHLKNKISRNFL